MNCETRPAGLAKRVREESLKQYTRSELSSFLHDLQQQEPILCNVKDGNGQCVAPTQSAAAVCCVLDSTTENLDVTLDADNSVDAKSGSEQGPYNPVVNDFSTPATLHNGVESDVGDSGWRCFTY